MRYVIYPSNCCSSNEKGRPRVSNRSAHFFLPLPQMTTVLKSIAKKERFHLPAEVSEMIVSESNGNLRKALLVFEALKMQSWVPSPLSSLSHCPVFISKLNLLFRSHPSVSAAPISTPMLSKRPNQTGRRSATKSPILSSPNRIRRDCSR